MAVDGGGGVDGGARGAWCGFDGGTVYDKHCTLLSPRLNTTLLGTLSTIGSKAAVAVTFARTVTVGQPLIVAADWTGPDYTHCVRLMQNRWPLLVGVHEKGEPVYLADAVKRSMACKASNIAFQSLP